MIHVVALDGWVEIPTLCYLGLLYVTFFLSRWNDRITLSIWPVISIIATASVAIGYIYQIEEVADWLGTVMSPEIIADLGMRTQAPPEELSTYLLRVRY